MAEAIQIRAVCRGPLGPLFIFRKIPLKQALATAHPAKFPDAVERAIGQRPALPPRLASLLDLPERAPHLAHDLVAVQDYVRRHARALPAGALP